jgi:polar amino acid transport system substrate-binding protein
MRSSRHWLKLATNRRTVRITSLIAGVAIFASVHVFAEDAAFPRFRHIDPGARPVTELPMLTLRLLTSADFAPFEFQGSDGLLKGISIDLARAACENMHLTCEFLVRPFPELLQALEKGDGDLVITPMHLTPQLVRRLAVTRPYYVSSAQFIVKNDSKIPAPDKRNIAGLRIGAVRDSAQAVFLKNNFAKFTLQDYPGEADMLKDLQAGNINAAFGDTLHMAFWLKGSMASGCCRTLGSPFMDQATFSRGTVFAASADRATLADAFDASLDSLEASGATAEIFARYAPVKLW